MNDDILAIDKWPTNGHLIATLAELGYLKPDWSTLDPTWGKGIFWKEWQPETLVGSDIDEQKSPRGAERPEMPEGLRGLDAMDLPFDDRSFDVVVLDPDYKENGTSTGKGPASSDEAYGVHLKRDNYDRLGPALKMIDEGARVAGKMLLVKCQPQVVSGKKHWQDHIIWQHVEDIGGWRMLDKFYFLGRRKQPEANPDGSPRRQVHARTNYSCMLVFKRTRV